MMNGSEARLRAATHSLGSTLVVRNGVRTDGYAQLKHISVK